MMTSSTSELTATPDGYLIDARRGVVYGKRGNPVTGTRHRVLGLVTPPRSGTRRVHVIIWESVHGPVPRGRTVGWLDGNPMNNAINNLTLVGCPNLVRRPPHQEKRAGCQAAYHDTRHAYRRWKCRCPVAAAENLEHYRARYPERPRTWRVGNRTAHTLIIDDTAVHIATSGDYERVAATLTNPERLEVMRCLDGKVGTAELARRIGRSTRTVERLRKKLEAA